MSENGEDQLVGEWLSDPEDTGSIKKYGKVSMTFTEDGRLIYQIHSSGETKIMLLTYRTQNGMLITNQPSAPREDRTAFSITQEGKLILVYGVDKCHYIRIHGSVARDDRKRT